MLGKEKETKSKPTPTPKPTQDSPTDTPNKTPRRKPRKLNKDPTPTTPASTSKDKASAEVPTPTEIEALKSRVHGLEAKVEELYKSGNLDRPGRSPRRRGKGRKASSQAQVPTLASTSIKSKVDDEDDEDVEELPRADADSGVDELVRLEGELEVARQDLAAFRPRGKHAEREDEDDVEDISRESTTGKESGRHVTLSGSYRIPLPASVSVDDVKHIQSGVSAAQNVARSFLEQRRAAVASSSSPNNSSKARPPPRSVSSSMEVIHADEEGGKKSWGEWIGGYSVAISRAVKNIEHEAAVESQRGGSGGAGGGGEKKKAAGKRPRVKTTISGEQLEGLMS